MCVITAEPDFCTRRTITARPGKYLFPSVVPFSHIWSHFLSTDILLGTPAGVAADVTSESTLVGVSWNSVENADRYTVTLSQTMGDDQLGLCREDSHTLSVDTSSLSVIVGQTNDDMLRAYTTYSITVVAESDELGNSQHSQPVTVTTGQKGEK